MARSSGHFSGHPGATLDEGMAGECGSVNVRITYPPAVEQTGDRLVILLGRADSLLHTSRLILAPEGQLTIAQRGHHVRMVVTG